MKILIVEDDLDIASIQRDFLENDGYTVTVTQDGKTGLAHALPSDFDLVLLDIMLPEMNGFEVCRELRKEKQTPVIFVSAKQDDIDKIRGFGLGADDYMMKPFSPLELLARVKAHINRYQLLTKQKPKTQEWVIQHLRINTTKRLVFVFDKEISLANKEYELLMFMIENPNAALSKQMILDEVWGVDAFVEPSTVAVHVNRLREKIEIDAAHPQLIETVWGIGYRFRMG